MTFRLGLAAFITLVSVAPRGLSSQQPPYRREILIAPNGEVLDFAPDGGWRNMARRVADNRRRLVWRRDFQTLNAPSVALSGAAAAACNPGVVVCGTEKIPAILFRFSDVGTGPNLPAGAGDTSKYTQILFGASAPSGKPYSVRTFYQQLSNGNIIIDGQVIGWVTLSGPEISYTGDPALDNCSGNPFGGVQSSQCNGLFSGSAISKMRSALNAALTAVDSGASGHLDWGQFDNDGPDGVPNSGDDNGIVDQFVFVHSELDGACGGGSANNHLWSHRSSGLNFSTHTAWAGHSGQFIKVRDYTLQSGVGGSGACSASAIMPVGTAAHETGHAFGLPDLYDTNGNTEGAGEWSLMGSGNYTSSNSPSRMDAWSLQQLGWVKVRQLTTSGTYSFGPVPTSDTVFMVRVQGTNPRGEYYLLENRQAAESDTAMIRIHCSASSMTYPSNCHGGLAIWHIDSAKVKDFGFNAGFNQVNAGIPTKTSPHGVLLVQADSLQELDRPTNDRGDAGDLWPGFGSHLPDTVGYVLRPNAHAQPVANDSVTFIGFQVDSVKQLVTDGEMSFRLQFGFQTIVRALDTLAKIKVDGASYGRFAVLLQDGSSHTIDMTSPQVTANGKRQYTWVSWSDGGAQAHTITGSLAGDSISATVLTRNQLKVSITGTGTVASNPSVDIVNGTFIRNDSSIQLTATPGGSDIFDRWSGDTVTTANPVTLTMAKPFTLVAVFAGPLSISSSTPTGGLLGKPYTFSFTAAGGNGTNTWTLISGNLPNGVTLASNGLLSGTPTAGGTFTITVRVTSGSQTQQTTVDFSVTEPTLAQASVLGQLLSTTNLLTSDDVAYLDIIGNRNGQYDVGDFLAWIERTNASPGTAPAPVPAADSVKAARAIPRKPEGKVTP